MTDDDDNASSTTIEACSIQLDVAPDPSSAEDIESSEIDSDTETESDYIPPPLTSPLSLTHSEEMMVEKVTRIGLVATHKCSSDILTDDDRREMNAIRVSLGMLPRRSKAAGTRGEGSEGEGERRSEGERGSERSSQPDTRVASEQTAQRLSESDADQLRADQLKTDEWSEYTTEASSTRGSGRSEHSSPESSRGGGCSRQEVTERYSSRQKIYKDESCLEGTVSGKEWLPGERLDETRPDKHTTTNYNSSRIGRTISRQETHRKYCACSYSTWCVSMNKTRQDQLLGLAPGCRGHGDLVCCVCRNSLQYQQSCCRCSLLRDCYGSHLCTAPQPVSHHLTGQRAAERYSPALYGQHYGPVSMQWTLTSLSTHQQHLSHPQQGSYFQQYLRKTNKPAHLPPLNPPPQKISFHQMREYKPSPSICMSLNGRPEGPLPGGILRPSHHASRLHPPQGPKRRLPLPKSYANISRTDYRAPL